MNRELTTHALGTVFLALLLCAGCESPNAGGWNDNRIEGAPVLTAAARVIKHQMQEDFGVTFTRNVLIEWRDAPVSEFYYRGESQIIYITASVKGDTGAMYQHVLHEMMEAFVHNLIGPYRYGHAPQQLNGRDINYYVANWAIHSE